MKVVVCLFDVQAAAYMQPMFVPGIGIAFRHLSDEIARGGEGNVLASHPGDFKLYELGVWDDQTGEFHLHEVPKMVCEVASLKLDKE